MSFSATIDAWVAETEERVTAVFKQSAQEVFSEAQRTRSEGGNMRVDTGFLRASAQASTQEMPQIKDGARPAEGQEYEFKIQPIALVIAGAKLGETIYFGYTAEYAAVREYHDGFVRLAAQNWQSIVTRVTEEAKRRVR